MSALDALTPAELAEVEQAVGYRRLERSLVDRGMWAMLRQDLAHEVFVPAPGAGSEWLATVPAGSTWELLSVFCVFATSATVATRTPMLQIKDADGNFVQRFSPGGTQAASLTGRFCWAEGLGAVSGVGLDMGALPTPPAPLASSWTVGSITANLDSADTFTGIVLMVRDWSPIRLVNACRSNIADLDSAGGIRYVT